MGWGSLGLQSSSRLISDLCCDPEFAKCCVPSTLYGTAFSAAMPACSNVTETEPQCMERQSLQTGLQALHSHSYWTEWQTWAVFFLARHIVLEESNGVFNVFSLMPVTFNAHCDLFLESQMLFSLFLFHLWPFLSGCSCNSTLCLRLDMSQSVILKRKKTFIRYTIACLSFCYTSTSQCISVLAGLKNSWALGHFQAY